MPKALEKYNFKSVEDVKATGLTKTKASLEPSFPKFNRETCTGCGLCEGTALLCPEHGRETSVVDEKKCLGAACARAGASESHNGCNIIKKIEEKMRDDTNTKN